MLEHTQILGIENKRSSFVFINRQIFAWSGFLHHRIFPAARMGTCAAVGIPSGKIIAQKAAAGIGNTHRAVYKALNFHIRRNMAADFLQLCQGKLPCGNHTLCAQIPPEQPRLVVRAVCLRGNVQLDLRAHSLRNHEQSGIGNNQRIRRNRSAVFCF